MKTVILLLSSLVLVAPLLSAIACGGEEGSTTMTLEVKEEGLTTIAPGVTREVSGGNPFWREYHVKGPIPGAHWYISSFDNPEDELDGLQERGATVEDLDLMRALFAVDGVTDVDIKPYSVSVGIGKAYDWSDVEPLVLDALNRALAKERSGATVTPLP